MRDGAGFGTRKHDKSVGQNGAGKGEARDRCTPLGIDFINDQLDTNPLHEKCSPIVFPLDCQNAWDVLSERAGDGIWI